jgi:hypothetical protein
VVGDGVGPVPGGGSERRQQERKALGPGHSTPGGTLDPLPVRTNALLQVARYGSVAGRSGRRRGYSGR